MPGGLDLAALISTLLKAQADAQLAQTNANHAKLIAFQTVTAQALAAKGGDKESTLTAAKKQILQACAGIMYADEFVVEQVYQDIDAKGGVSDAWGRTLRKRLKPVPLSPYKTNIHITPQLIAMVKTFSFSSKGDKTYAGCTKGITIFAVPWRTAEAINEDLAEDKYFKAATLKSVTDIRKHVTSAKVELPTSLQGLVRVLNNYCRLLDVLFGPDCPHLTHVISIRDGLETHEAELESRLTGVLILHLMWRVHHDARQFFLACERWEDGEQLPHSTLGNTVRQLVDDSSIQVTVSGGNVPWPPVESTRTNNAVHPSGSTNHRAASNDQYRDSSNVPEGGRNLQHTLPGHVHLGTVQERQGTLQPIESWTRRSLRQLWLVWEVFGLPVQARDLYRGNQPAGSDSQGHGERIGNDEGRGRGLTGQPGRYTGRPGSVTPSPSSLTPTQHVGAAAWLPPGGARRAWVLDLGPCRTDRIGLVLPSVSSVLSPH